MQLSDDIEVSHSYFERISLVGAGYEVVLNDSFPASFRKFVLRPAADPWDGFKSVESDLGLVEEDHTCWLNGTGRSHAEAAQAALAMFVNWVVHPADVDVSNFRFRTLA